MSTWLALTPEQKAAEAAARAGISASSTVSGMDLDDDMEVDWGTDAQPMTPDKQHIPRPLQSPVGPPSPAAPMEIPDVGAEKLQLACYERQAWQTISENWSQG